MPAGRPLKYKSAKTLKVAIERYFDRCIETKCPPTVSGLCLELGMTRESLLNYNKRDEFFSTIHAAKMRIMEFLEIATIRNGNSSGPIFLLKSMGIKDTKSVEITGKDGGELKWQIEVVRPKDGQERVNALPPASKQIPAPNPAQIEHIQPETVETSGQVMTDRLKSIAGGLLKEVNR